MREAVGRYIPLKRTRAVLTHARSWVYVKQVQKSLNGNVEMGCTMRKSSGNKVIPLAILSMILAQSCVTPPYIIKAKGPVTHDCAISLYP